MVNKIHVRIQKFIHSFAMGYALKLDISEINFGSFLKTSKDREISFILLPAFVKKPDSKKRRRDNHNESNGRKKKKEGKKNGSHTTKETH